MSRTLRAIRVALPFRSLPLAGLLGIGAFGADAFAQGPAFSSPGQSTYATIGQTTRFSTEFNPAFGFALDFVGDYLDTDGGDDGFDARVRLIEFNASAYVDPSLWAYATIVTEGLEEPEIEEAAGEYIGFDDNATVKAGRFFVDFGKQMQNHLEELRTLERPLVLREYLGEELAGTGAQVDYWLPLNDTTPLRASFGVFGDLVGHAHGEEEEGVVQEPLARKDLDELSFTARVTAMTELGDYSTLQLGASARYVPAFVFEDAESGDELFGNENTVVGADLTFGHVDDTGQRRFTAGGELLASFGDQAAEYDMGTATFTVYDDAVLGGFGFADYQWSPRHSAGLQASYAELPERPGLEATEYDVYYTYHPTEFRRLRFGVTLADSDEVGDEVRGYVQFTLWFGSHAHGINW